MIIVFLCEDYDYGSVINMCRFGGKDFFRVKKILVNPFYAAGNFLCPLKTYVFRGYGKLPVA